MMMSIQKMIRKSNGLWPPDFKGDRDLIVIPDLRGQPIDPSSKEGFLTTKIGMDATRPKKEGFEKVDVPKEVKSRLASILEKSEAKGEEVKKLIVGISGATGAIYGIRLLRGPFQVGCGNPSDHHRGC